MAQITKYIAIWLVLTGSAVRTYPQNSSSALHDSILRHILCLQFGTADSLLTAAGRDPHRGTEIIYLRNYLAFLDALVAGDRARYDMYLSQSASCLASIRNADQGAEGQLAVLSAIHLQSSFLCAFHGDHIKAARNFYVAKRYLRQAEAAGPDDPEKDKLGGLIHLVAGSAPAEYHWLMRIFGIRGDIGKGLELLEEYHESVSGPHRLESCLILLYARQMTGQEMASRQADCREAPTTLQRYFLAYHALRSGKGREALELLDGWQQVHGEADFAYLDLLLGEALLNFNQPGAGDYLIRFLDRTLGENYVKTAWHKLSWYRLLEGDMAGYHLAKDNVLQKGEMILDADRQAFREASEDAQPNAALLRSRLYFDAGEYQRSFEILQGIRPGDLSGSKDSLEYIYRGARIADRLGKWDKAVSGYREVMEAGMGSSWYFPSNAALHLGMIQEAMADTVGALESYRSCLKLNESAYRNSIGTKAKMGIRRLKQH